MDIRKLTAIAILFFLAVSLSQITKPLIADEVYWPKVADGIQHTGAPSFSHSENQPTETPPFLPPLFPYYVATMLSLGFPAVFIRFLSLIFVILTIPLVYFIGKKLAANKIIPHLAVIIYSISPLVVQGGVLLDLDNSILTFLVALFFYTFIKFESNLTPKKYTIIGLLFGVLMLAKPTTPPVIIISIFLFYIFNRKIREAFKRSLIISLIGFIPFFIGSYIYSAVAKVPLFGSLLLAGYAYPKGVPLTSYLLNNVLYAGLRAHIFWIIPALFLLLVYFLGSRIKLFRKSGRLELIDMFFIFVILLFIEYVSFGQSPWRFPKYFTPAMPLVALLSAFAVFRYRDSIPKNPKLHIFSAAIIVAIHMALIPNPLLHSTSFIPAAKAATLYMMPLLAVFLINFAHSKKLKPAILTSFLVTFVVTALYLGILHATAYNMSTTFYYGDYGMDSVVNFVKSNTGPNSLIIAPWDVGYGSGRKIYEAQKELETAGCTVALKRLGIYFAVLRGDWNGRYNPILFKCLKANYNETNIGNYYLYKTG